MVGTVTVGEATETGEAGRIIHQCWRAPIGRVDCQATMPGLPSRDWGMFQSCLHLVPQTPCPGGSFFKYIRILLARPPVTAEVEPRHCSASNCTQLRPRCLVISVFARQLPLSALGRVRILAPCATTNHDRGSREPKHLQVRQNVKQAEVPRRARLRQHWTPDNNAHQRMTFHMQPLQKAAFTYRHASVVSGIIPSFLPVGADKKMCSSLILGLPRQEHAHSQLGWTFPISPWRKKSRAVLIII